MCQMDIYPSVGELEGYHTLRSLEILFHCNISVLSLHMVDKSLSFKDFPGRKEGRKRRKVGGMKERREGKGGLY